MALRNLTADGRSRLAEIARRHGVSDDAAAAMLMALTQGGGTMAQFSHPEFGGSGQWMRGGMTMVSDLFNNALKATVDSLCNDLSTLLLNPPPGTWQETASPGPSPPGFGGADWWPAALGVPNASGAQNDLRYAYFADAGRLAIDIAGTRTLYDTADHRISGVSQQQGNGWSLTFTSQYGTVPVSSLRVVDGGPQPGEPPAAPPAPFTPAPVPAPHALVPDTLAPDSLAGTVWSFGPTGDAGITITLAPDGGITGSGDARVRYWSAEDGGLTFYDSDGRVSVRFADPAAGDPGAGLSGHDPARPDQTYALRPPAPQWQPTGPSAPPASPALPLDVTAGDWLLEDHGGNRLCVLRLSADGRVEGGRGSEAAWRITDSSVVLLHGSGRPTARFDIFQFRAGRWTLIGAPLNDESATLFLKQP
ncbi:hypothetical protein [Azospirillum sp. TSO35-2]|uniref:hypothetical protein n=1 Tax=Azospirillum sp. TSO35-2 TaxID=716796 RepID=UPI0018EE9A11|nr:hypothetical protein [Azospirillum sp. TSO35-2]